MFVFTGKGKNLWYTHQLLLVKERIYSIYSVIIANCQKVCIRKKLGKRMVNALHRKANEWDLAVGSALHRLFPFFLLFWSIQMSGFFHEQRQLPLVWTGASLSCQANTIFSKKNYFFSGFLFRINLYLIIALCCTSCPLTCSLRVFRIPTLWLLK